MSYWNGHSWEYHWYDGAVEWWQEWGFLVYIMLFFGGLIGLAMYGNYLRLVELDSIGCERTPVDWKNGTFYVTDDYYACPYGGK